jgi:hypothetical protein
MCSLSKKFGTSGSKRKKMESALFALDLVAMVYVCFWAIRQDTPDKSIKSDD